MTKSENNQKVEKKFLRKEEENLKIKRKRIPHLKFQKKR